MKKLLLSVSALALVFAMASCKTGDPKKAGQEVGKKYCECQKLEKKSGKKNEKEAQKCYLEYRKMYNEYAAKFVEKKKDMEKYTEALEKAMEKCNNRD